MSDTNIRLLDDLGAELARAARRPGRARVGRLPAVRGQAVAAALALVGLLAGAAYAVPATRAAIDDITGTFSSWMEGDDVQAPGRALRPGDDAPDWVREGRSRQIAEAGGVGLYVTRVETERRGVQLEFWLGDSTAISGTLEDWRARFDDHAVLFLGIPPVARGRSVDSRGRFRLMGLTARSVERVAVTYENGPPTFVDGVDGGFVAMVDSGRAVDELVAYDAAGRELDRADVSGAGQSLKAQEAARVGP